MSEKCACGCGGDRPRFIQGHDAPLPIDRFWAKVQKRGPDECWEWTGTPSERYGSIVWRGKKVNAHRVAWELANGSIRPGLHVLHLCDNSRCVNPAHLRVGTHTENMEEMHARGRGSQPTFQGEDHPRAQLSVDQVREIRRREGESQRGLGREFGVSQTTIRRIQRRETWAFVE